MKERKKNNNKNLKKNKKESPFSLKVRESVS